MNNKRAWWVLLILVLVLAGCGTGDDGAAEIEPTPTPAPTLSPEERATFGSGTAENPLQMIIRPVNIIPMRLNELLVTEFGVTRGRIQADAELRTLLDLDDLTVLNPALRRDFGVELTPDTAESLATLADLERTVRTLVAETVTDSILSRTGLHFELIFVDAYADALVDLCRSGGGLVALPWLDGVTYTAALARNCGQPALRVAGGASPVDLFAPLDESAPAPAETTTDDAAADDESPQEQVVDSLPPDFDPSNLPQRFGSPAVIVANADLGTTDASLVSGRTFCRLDHRDFYSWLLPSLVLQTRAIDLERAAAEVRDYANPGALLRAVANGTCAAAGVSRADYDALAPLNGVTVIAETVDMPYGVLMVPLEVGLGVRLALAEHLPALAAHPRAGRALHLLLGQAALVPVEPGDLAELDAFMQSTGLDFAQLGD